jgi:hypothetical protein
MAAAYSKMEGYIGRLALNLHVIWEIASGKACPSEEIPLFIMEMAIALSKFYIGQVKLVHAHSDDDQLAPHIIKLIELSKRLDSNGGDGWVKAKQYQETFPKKKRPSAQQARGWMHEAVVLGYGRIRGEGNRLEYHWFYDNENNDGQESWGSGSAGDALGKFPAFTSPTSSATPASPALGVDTPLSPNDLGKVGEQLGNTLPQVESHIKQGIDDNSGNLGNTLPQLSLLDEAMDSSKQIKSDFVLEGGQLPQPSPTLLQDGCDEATTNDSDLGNNFGNPSPTLPQVPQVRDSYAHGVTIVAAMDYEAIAPTSDDRDAKLYAPAPTATVEEPTAIEPKWEEGEQIFVRTDIPSLKQFNDRQGTISVVKEESAQCLVCFGDEFMHIPFRCLRRIELWDA